MNTTTFIPPTAAEYNAAALAQRTVDKLNHETLVKNRLIRERNYNRRLDIDEEHWAIPYHLRTRLYDSVKEKQLPPPHKLDACHARTLEAESLARVPLQSVTEREWYKRVMTIEDRKIRGATACVVWWDYISDRPRHIGLFETFLKKDSACQVSDAKLEQGLLIAGYTPALAATRAQGINYDTPIEEEAVA